MELLEILEVREALDLQGLRVPMDSPDLKAIRDHLEHLGFPEQLGQAEHQDKSVRLGLKGLKAPREHLGLSVNQVLSGHLDLLAPLVQTVRQVFKGRQELQVCQGRKVLLEIQDHLDLADQVVHQVVKDQAELRV